jgi:hypothetical protein
MTIPIRMAFLPFAKSPREKDLAIHMHTRTLSYYVSTQYSTVGIYPLKEGRHEDACPRVDLLSKGR